MASLFNKFQEAVKVLAKRPIFARDPRQIQFESDINRLFLYTSHHRLGKDADEKDAEEIIDMSSKAPLDDQQKQVQENIHSQIEAFCRCMDEILLHSQSVSKLAEVSQKLKELLGYTLEIKPSQIPHQEAGQGLFLNGEAYPGAVIAFYPGVVYSPAYYRYIPGYPRVDTHNPYLITRYDGAVINAKPWGAGGESRELWDGSQASPPPPVKPQTGSDRIWSMLSQPLDARRHQVGQVLERRNPLAFAHFANHPPKDTVPNVMLCPYDFPLSCHNEALRPYIPNVSFGHGEVKMKKVGSFWFKTGSGEVAVPVLKSLVLVATQPISDQQEVLLNYRLSNLRRRPAWYVSVDEEEDQRRWG